ncbi:hypothetical protein MLD38_020112 [Melastoma candidum]|uniref:Uncharacterized protein n=1 Tax=Melastoma candidum TaxID=119954 RepID=A0ACB9QC73_9MYRT|nr:hypothetical protein MLD38_020112 [Melastoma candidum]
MDETTLDAKDASFRENGHKLVLGRERLTIWGEPGATGASQKYEKAVKCIEFDHSFSDEEKSTATAFRLSCYLNNAACKFRLSAYHETTILCNKSSILETSKPLYRRSQANLKISNLSEAPGRCPSNHTTGK